MVLDLDPTLISLDYPRLSKMVLGFGSNFDFLGLSKKSNPNPKFFEIQNLESKSKNLNDQLSLILISNSVAWFVWMCSEIIDKYQNTIVLRRDTQQIKSQKDDYYCCFLVPQSAAPHRASAVGSRSRQRRRIFSFKI